MDLSLISLDELIEESEKRCDAFVCAYQLNEDKERTNKFYTFYGKGSWLKSSALTNILNNDCLNNWEGELNTLQRINEEEND